MSQAEPNATAASSPVTLQGSIVWKKTLGDCLYELFVCDCTCCDKPIYRLMKCCGASWSVYQISEKDYQNIDGYVAELHESFALDVHSRILLLRKAIGEFNSRGCFDAEGMPTFQVRLLDKARLILNRFAANGRLEEILDQSDNVENDVAAAFLLGWLATENFWRDAHQEAVVEGWAHIEGREAGRPLAVAARLRQGKRSRRAVIEAATILYGADGGLRRNDSKTAAMVAEQRLQSLRKRDGTYLGPDAIVKHLRAARRDGQLEEKIPLKFRHSENRV
jgi:hypothetical protein